MPKIGVQSYITLKQSVREHRDIRAVCCWTEPAMPMDTTEALVKGRIKLCKSGDAIRQLTKADVKANVAKLKSGQQKLRLLEEVEEKKKENKVAATRWPP